MRSLLYLGAAVCALACASVGARAQNVEPCVGGCTLTQGFWKNHAPWPLDMGGDSMQNMQCNIAWPTILQTPPAGSAWYILSHQYIAARLNVLYGACTTENIRTALDQAAELLDVCALNDAPNTATGANMTAIADFLAAYNEGDIGPGHCSNAPPVEPPTPPPMECPPNNNCRYVLVCEVDQPPTCNDPNDTRTDPPCEGGCTLTQGYWKTHNTEGNGKNTEPWLNNLENEVLCNATWLSWMQVNAPAGNAWFQLAHQWIAASLNVASGACTTEDIDAALAAGELILASNCAEILQGNPIRPFALAAAETLDQFNNGLLGPGHCS